MLTCAGSGKNHDDGVRAPEGEALRTECGGVVFGKGRLNAATVLDLALGAGE